MSTAIAHTPAWTPWRSAWSLWLAVGVLVAAVALAQFRQPQPAVAPPAPFAQLLPERFGDWQLDKTVMPVAPTPDVQQALDQIYDEIVSRTYINSAGERVMLVVAYGGDQSDGLKAHRQEVCYSAQGFVIDRVAAGAVALPGKTLPVVRVQSHKGERHEPMSYWFMMGNQVRLSRLGRLFAQIDYGLKGEVPDGLLVRVSSVGKDASAAFALQDAFVAQLLQNVSPDTQARLAGRP
jgi:EpsI family protein